jgi:MFS family permease
MGPDRVAQVRRRTLAVLVAAQVFGGVAFFIGFAVAALLARELTGSDALSGVPPALGVAASALAAAPVAAWMGRAGRRPGLAACHCVAAAGALLVVLAAAAGSFLLLCAGMAAFGVGNTANLLARYAGADLSPRERRGRAISIVLLATALGAVLGPNLAAATAPLAAAIGVAALAGPFLVAAAAYAVAALILALLLRPDPLLTARAIAGGPGDLDPGEPAPAAASALVEERTWPPMAVAALGTLIAVNAAMLAIMTMTPIHLEDGGQSLSVVGLVFSLHVGAMFIPSPVTGVLVDRLGRLPVIALGAEMLLVAGILAATSGHSVARVTAALVVLGLGWNFGMLGASALLTDAVPLARRAHAQGFADLAMGLAGGGASIGAGVLLGVGGYGLLGVVGAGCGLLLLAMAIRSARPGRAGLIPYRSQETEGVP